MTDHPASFIGRAWSFPPSFAQNGCLVDCVEHQENIQQSLLVLLSTVPGERVLLEDYGCDLQQFMFEEIDRGLLNRLASFIKNAILKYETRIDLESVEIDDSDSAEGYLQINLVYRILSTNSRFNMVYPYYLSEASRPT